MSALSFYCCGQSCDRLGCGCVKGRVSVTTAVSDSHEPGRGLPSHGVPLAAVYVVYAVQASGCESLRVVTAVAAQTAQMLGSVAVRPRGHRIEEMWADDRLELHAGVDAHIACSTPRLAMTVLTSFSALLLSRWRVRV